MTYLESPDHLPHPGFQKSLEKRKTGPLVPLRRGLVPEPAAQPRFGIVICQFIFRQLKCKHLYNSDMREPTSPTVKEQVKVCKLIFPAKHNLGSDNSEGIGKAVRVAR